jgi:hypothetical protein
MGKTVHLFQLSCQPVLRLIKGFALFIPSWAMAIAPQLFRFSWYYHSAHALHMGAKQKLSCFTHGCKTKADTYQNQLQVLQQIDLGLRVSDTPPTGRKLFQQKVPADTILIVSLTSTILYMHCALSLIVQMWPSLSGTYMPLDTVLRPICMSARSSCRFQNVHPSSLK